MLNFSFANPDGLIRLLVFLIEIILTASLIAWMRGSQRNQIEPWSFVFKVLGFGAITAIISAFVEIKYSFNINELQEIHPELVERFGTWYELINSISASLIEELAKYTVAVFCVINTRHYHKMSDAIVYLVFIGLGFSLVEDAIFFLNPETNAPYRLISFYMHSGTSAIIGYSFGRYKFGMAKYPELIRAILGAVGLHFVYNSATTLNIQPASFYLTLAVTFYITLQVFILFRKALTEEYNLDRQLQPQHPHRLLNLKKA